MIKQYLFFILCINCSFVFAQSNYMQTVRGQVTDKVTSAGLPGVIIRLKNDSTKTHIATTDSRGNFKLEGIKVGRRSFIVSLF
ncbi:MAG: carboxypeptidase regulatory-like domain-containing protein, partial [Bacteroidia bacterium]|nr:carboxypeptidase regulatory-like domain-containing protein [Bacteroidia bacterium]